MASSPVHTRHRERLRKRFLTERASLSDAELLELLLTYAIPRQDVAPLATQLLTRFGSLEAVLEAPHQELVALNGIGDAAAILLGVVRDFQAQTQHDYPRGQTVEELEHRQHELESPAEDKGSPMPAVAPTPAPPPPPPTKADIRTYIVDLSEVALEYLPHADEFPDFASFSTFLGENLPYNSEVTRKRYASYLTNRFFPAGKVETPLVEFLARGPDEASAKQVLFYETVRAEPAVQYFAEQVLWPALPAGSITRDHLKEELYKRFPEASEGTIKRMAYSLVGLYDALDVGPKVDGGLQFKVREGTLTAFLYVLGAELPEAGIYTFEALEQGPMRYWLLWDRDWMRRQLYNLRDLGVIAKVSEIDNYRQFTLQHDRESAMQAYFTHPERETLVLREGADMEEAGS